MNEDLRFVADSLATASLYKKTVPASVSLIRPTFLVPLIIDLLAFLSQVCLYVIYVGHVNGL